MTTSRCIALFLVAAVLTVASPLFAAGPNEITIEKSDQGMDVKIDGKLFTRYAVDFNGTPILWPIIGPTGKPMTRAFPMGKQEGEKEDHPHHRSFWFNHGDVNGLSYWHKETIKHREFVKLDESKLPGIVTRNDWLSPDGKKVCEDERTFRFGTDGKSRWIDFDITIKATEGPVKFGDTKEGTMGIRVPASMKVDSKQGGQIVNAGGDTDQAAWGKSSPWVDYHGPVDGETVGIAIMNHPSSFRFPTYWHVRTYGLFAANPFGLHDFKGSRSVDGSQTLAKGETMTFRYRILFHLGDEKSGKVAEAFKSYTNQRK